MKKSLGMAFILLSTTWLQAQGKVSYIAKHGLNTQIELDGNWPTALNEFVCNCQNGIYPENKFTHLMIIEEADPSLLFRYLSIVDDKALPWVDHSEGLMYSYNCRPASMHPRPVEMLNTPGKINRYLECVESDQQKKTPCNFASHSKGY